jgi:hypothetical protein
MNSRVASPILTPDTEAYRERGSDGTGLGGCLLQCVRLVLMLWTAPPPAREAPSNWVLLEHS